MIFNNLLLSLQLENYKNTRFLKFVYSHPKFWLTGSKRQTLEYTSKAKLLLVLAVLFFIFDLWASIYFTSWVLQVISLLWVLVALPIYFVAANVILSPLDSYLKNRIITRAKKKMLQHTWLKVIAITGSFWKTTTKEILSTILSESYNVLATQGTKNTPLWISNLINTHLTKQHQIFIVEMWAYMPWDIKDLCDIVWPNISVLTWITLQHLERFKNLENIIDAKFEILEALWENDFAVVDTSTEWVKRWLKEKKLLVKNIKKVEKWTSYRYLDNLWGIQFKMDGHEIRTKLLANYILQTVEICYEISKYLWQDIKNFKLWVSKLDFIEHRMQLIHNPQSDIYIIDDSFNGNLQWVEAILDLMTHTPFSGRKILIAWWIVELWEQTEPVHIKLGRQMWKVADMILLVEGPVGNALKVWLQESWYPLGNIKLYKTPLSLHEDLKNITKPGDMIVFQNDLPDNYL